MKEKIKAENAQVIKVGKKEKKDIKIKKKIEVFIYLFIFFIKTK